jgi:hypothetical protein
MPIGIVNFPRAHRLSPQQCSAAPKYTNVISFSLTVRSHTARHRTHSAVVSISSPWKGMSTNAGSSASLCAAGDAIVKVRRAIRPGALRTLPVRHRLKIDVHWGAFLLGVVSSNLCAAGTSDVLTGTPPSLVSRRDSINDTSRPRAGPKIEGTWSAGSPRSPPVASYGHGCHSEAQNMRVSSTRSSWSSTERVSECTAPNHPECLSAHRVRVRASGITRRL